MTVTTPDGESWKAYRRAIDRILCEDRPARAGVDEREWRERAYGYARNHIPDETNLVRHIAQQEVDRREAQATKRGNILLRAYARGASPLDWSIVGPWPVKVGELRIRLDAATPDDIEDAARELEGRAKQVYDEVVMLVGCMRDLARRARRAGMELVAQLGDESPSGPFEPGEPPYGDGDWWGDDDDA